MVSYSNLVLICLVCCAYLNFLLPNIFMTILFFSFFNIASLFFDLRPDMDFNSGGHSPAVLQLHRWDSSEVQLNLSEFREAFISPTRELLLLLSHHFEALLLPLVKGESSKFHLSEVALDLSTLDFLFFFFLFCREIYRL